MEIDHDLIIKIYSITIFLNKVDEKFKIFVKMANIWQTKIKCNNNLLQENIKIKIKH